MWRTTFKQFLILIRRNRFFTFVNLFGISFTIMLVMTIQVTFESHVWPGGPEKNNDKMLFLYRTVISKERSNSIGGVNQRVIEEYILKMKTPKSIGFCSHSDWSNISPKGVNKYQVKMTNAAFMQIFDYKIIDGRIYTEKEVKNSSPVVVISESLRDDLFGKESPLGKTIDIQNTAFRIIGVIKEVPNNCKTSKSDIWYPYTIKKHDLPMLDETGVCSVVFATDNNDNSKAITEELRGVERKIEAVLDGEDVMLPGPYDSLDKYFAGYGDPRYYKGKTVNLLWQIGKMFLVLLVPAISLIALNLTRVQERSEEIAVRKTFGASSMGLIKQILFENFLLTLIGAVIGFVFAWVTLEFFGDILFSELNGNNVTINLSIITFFVCLAISLILSIVSGFIPAIKMSKLKPALVMKGGEL